MQLYRFHNCTRWYPRFLVVVLGMHPVFLSVSRKTRSSVNWAWTNRHDCWRPIDQWPTIPWGPVSPDAGFLSR